MAGSSVYSQLLVLLAGAGLVGSSYGCSTPQEVNHQRDHGQYQEKMYETGSDVECQEAEQPENYQNRGDNCEHNAS
jgi:hypothetical protein